MNGTRDLWLVLKTDIEWKVQVFFMHPLEFMSAEKDLVVHNDIVARTLLWGQHETEISFNYWSFRWLAEVISAPV